MNYRQPSTPRTPTAEPRPSVVGYSYRQYTHAPPPPHPSPRAAVDAVHSYGGAASVGVSSLMTRLSYRRITHSLLPPPPHTHAAVDAVHSYGGAASVGVSSLMTRLSYHQQDVLRPAPNVAGCAAATGAPPAFIE